MCRFSVWAQAGPPGCPLDLLQTRSLPFLTRRNYYFEMLHLIPWGIVTAMVESTVASIIVAKTFHGSHWMVTVASASPFFANLLSLVWGMLCIGRRKRRVVSVFAALVTSIMFLVALIPHEDRQGWLFVAEMALAQAFMSGVVTSRTALWRVNYPQQVRATITARLQAMRFLMGICSSLVLAAVFDFDPRWYRVVFPIVGVCGLTAILLLRQVRVRGERSERRTRRRRRESGFQPGLAEPFSLVALLSPGQVFGHMRRVLGEDAKFRQYCLAMMLSGGANLMIVPVMVILVTEFLQMSYLGGIGLLFALHRLVLLGSLNRWGRFLDRVGVVRFRALNQVCWASALLFGMIGSMMLVNGSDSSPFVLPGALAWFLASRLATGAGMGGSALAWNLGHLHFAKPEDAEAYMGIHVFLAGVRGLTMPFLGIWLWSTIGWYVWAIALALSVLGLVAFTAMARDERRATSSDAATNAHTGGTEHRQKRVSNPND